jgi:hypothetical protein
MMAKNIIIATIIKATALVLKPMAFPVPPVINSEIITAPIIKRMEKIIPPMKKSHLSNFFTDEGKLYRKSSILIPNM